MFKKFLTSALLASTTLLSFGGIVATDVASAAVDGGNVKLQCPTNSKAGDVCRKVYYVQGGKLYWFPNEDIYSTWFAQTSGKPDWTKYTIVSQSELNSYGNGGIVFYRPGSRIVKSESQTNQYVVEKGGIIRKVVSDSVLTSIYGADWAKKLVTVPDSVWFVLKENTTPVSSASDYNYQAVWAASPTIMTDWAGVNNPTPSPVTSGTATVTLAADTPASGFVVSSAARYAFTKFTVTAGAADVVIDSWLVERMGAASDASFSSIDILDADTLLPINESGKTFSSEHTANFTEDYTVRAGTSHSFIIAGNMVAAASMANFAGEVPQLALKSITLKGGAAVNGTLPLVGNYQSLNVTPAIGSATVSRGAYTNATSSSLEVGKKDYTFLSFQIQAGSTEDTQFSQVRVYQSGSASLSGDLANIALYQDGTKLANGVVNTTNSNYVSFTFPALTLTKGQTTQFQVKADLVSGSARTVKLGIYRGTDLLVKGLSYGYNITPTFSGTGSSSNNPVLSDNEFTISQGTLRISRSSTVGSSNIAVGSDQVLGAFEFEAKGEPVIITALTLTVASSTTNTLTYDALRSVRLVDENGKTVAGPTDRSLNALTVPFTDTFTVPTGIHAYKVVGTLSTSGGWSTNDTITVSFNPASAITAKGESTNLSLTATPNSSTSASTQTVKVAGLTVTRNSNPTNKNVITNSVGVLAGSWRLDATNSGEDVRVTSIAIRASTTGRASALTLKVGNTTLDPVNDNPVTSNDSTATSTFALSQPLIIPKGTSKDVDLYINIGSASLAGEVDSYGITSDNAITAYGVTTGNSASVSVTASDGALLTIASGGTLGITIDSNTPVSKLVVAGTTGVALSDIRLKATNEAVDITKLTVKILGGSVTGTRSDDTTAYQQVSKVWLKLDGQVIGNTSGYSMGASTQQVNFERGQVTIPDNTTGKVLSIVGDLVQIGTNQPGVANSSLIVSLDDPNNFGTTKNMLAYGNGSNSVATPSYSSATGNALIIHKAIPSVVVVAPTSKLNASAVLAQVKITAVGNKIGVYRMSYVTTTSTGVALSNGYIRLNSCQGGACDGIIDNTTLSTTASTGTYLADGAATWSFTVNNVSGKSYLGIGAGSTAVVDFYTTFTGTTNSDTVSTSFLGDTATSVDSAASTTGPNGHPAAEYVFGVQGDFVWSDLNSVDANSATALTTAQWYNGYLVAGLGSTATSTPVSIGE